VTPSWKGEPWAGLDEVAHRRVPGANYEVVRDDRVLGRIRFETDAVRPHPSRV